MEKKGGTSNKIKLRNYDITDLVAVLRSIQAKGVCTGVDQQRINEEKLKAIEKYAFSLNSYEKTMSILVKLFNANEFAYLAPEFASRNIRLFGGALMNCGALPVYRNTLLEALRARVKNRIKVDTCNTFLSKPWLLIFCNTTNELFLNAGHEKIKRLCNLCDTKLSGKSNMNNWFSSRNVVIADRMFSGINSKSSILNFRAFETEMMLGHDGMFELAELKLLSFKNCNLNINETGVFWGLESDVDITNTSFLLGNKEATEKMVKELVEQCRDRHKRVICNGIDIAGIGSKV